MTRLEERAREMAKKACESLYYDIEGLEHGGPPMSHEDNRRVIEQALIFFAAEAVKEEREACAEIADDHNGCVDVKCLRDSNCGATIANQILKRGGGTSEMPGM